MLLEIWESTASVSFYSHQEDEDRGAPRGVPMAAGEHRMQRGGGGT